MDQFAISEAILQALPSDIPVVDGQISLIDWLKFVNEKNAKGEKVSPFLQVSLLQSFIESLETKFKKPIHTKPSPQKLTWKQKLGIALGISAGVITTLFDVFGSISVVLSTVFDIATFGFALFWASLGLAVISAAAFIVYQLIALSKTTDSSALEARKNLKAYLEERQQINALAQFLDSGPFIRNHEQHGFTPNELDKLRTMMVHRNKLLKEKGEELTQIRKGVFPKFLRIALLTFVSASTFTAGFMIGFFAISMLMSLIPAIVIPLWGCVLIGVLVGASSFSAFWFLSRHDIHGMVDKIIGLDKKSTEALMHEADLEIDPLQNAANEIPLAPAEFYDFYDRLFPPLPEKPKQLEEDHLFCNPS